MVEPTLHQCLPLKMTITLMLQQAWRLPAPALHNPCERNKKKPLRENVECMAQNENSKTKGIIEIKSLMHQWLGMDFTLLRHWPMAESNGSHDHEVLTVAPQNRCLKWHHVKWHQHYQHEEQVTRQHCQQLEELTEHLLWEKCLKGQSKKVHF